MTGMKQLQKLRLIDMVPRLCAVVCLTLAAALAYSQPIDQEKVNHIKAAYIFHMAQLTTWPSEDLDERDDLRLLFIGNDTNQLAEILADKTKSLLVQGHRLQVSQLPEFSSGHVLPDSVQIEIGEAHIIYVSQELTANTLAACRRYANHSTLFAGDGQVVPRQGGMVGFYVDDQRVRINVNLLQVEQAAVAATSNQAAVVVPSNNESTEIRAARLGVMTPYGKRALVQELRNYYPGSYRDFRSLNTAQVNELVVLFEETGNLNEVLAQMDTMGVN